MKASTDQTMVVFQLIIQNQWIPKYVVGPFYSISRNEDERCLSSLGKPMEALLISNWNGMKSELEEELLLARESEPAEMKEMTDTIYADETLLQIKKSLFDEHDNDWGVLREHARDLLCRIENSFELSVQLHIFHVFEVFAAFSGDVISARQWIENNLIEPYIETDKYGYFVCPVDCNYYEWEKTQAPQKTQSTKDQPMHAPKREEMTLQMCRCDRQQVFLLTAVCVLI